MSETDFIGREIEQTEETGITTEIREIPDTEKKLNTIKRYLELVLPGFKIRHDWHPITLLENKAYYLGIKESNLLDILSGTILYTINQYPQASFTDMVTHTVRYLEESTDIPETVFDNSEKIISVLKENYPGFELQNLSQGVYAFGLLGIVMDDIENNKIEIEFNEFIQFIALHVKTYASVSSDNFVKGLLEYLGTQADVAIQDDDLKKLRDEIAISLKNDDIYDTQEIPALKL